MSNDINPNVVEKQQLGPEQLEWIERMEAQPELQIDGMLGIKTETTFGMCCLGMKVLIDYEHAGVEPLFVPNEIKPTECYLSTLNPPSIDGVQRTNRHSLDRYSEIGLQDSNGSFWGNVTFPAKKPYPDDAQPRDITSLAGLNDFGYTWTEIAAMMRANPAIFFNKVA